MKISNVFTLDEVKLILKRYDNHSYKKYIKYFVNENKYKDEIGFFTDKFIVGIHNRHTHFAISELQKYLETAKQEA